MGWSGIEIGGYACLIIAIAVLIAAQVFMWRERRDILARLERARDCFEDMRPRQEYKIQSDKKLREGRLYTGPEFYLPVDSPKLKPKVITEEREALIEQRLAKEAQARDPIFP